MKKFGKAIIAFAGMVVGVVAGSAITFKKIRVSNGSRSKFRAYYDTTNQWLALKNQDKSLDEYFANNGYQTMAIYGMGELGNRLYEELKKSSKVEIKYAVDENLGYVYEGDIQVLLPDDDFEPVDVVVVTPIFDFDNIHDKLSKNVNAPIVSLEEVVFDI